MSDQLARRPQRSHDPALGEDPMTSTALTITSDAHAERVTVHLAGEVDISNADLLRNTLLQHFRNGHTTVTIDMSGLTFIDCAGLSALMRARNDARDHSGSIHLDGVVQHSVVRIMHLTGILQAFPPPGAAPISY
ncbi:STAS domain-containing protein [Actinoallomurus vinaceus]